MKPITMFEDCRGIIHKTQEDCEQAEKWYKYDEEFDISSHAFQCDISDVEDLAKYLKKNAHWILPMMGWQCKDDK